MAPSGQLTPPALQAVLADAALAGDWTLDGARSTIRLRSSIWGLIPVKGVFGQVTGQGTVSPSGDVSGTITPMGSSRRVLRERSTFRHTRATIVVSQAPRLSTPLASDRLRRSQASWTASSASASEPSIR